MVSWKKKFNHTAANDVVTGVETSKQVVKKVARLVKSHAGTGSFDSAQDDRSLEYCKPRNARTVRALGADLCPLCLTVWIYWQRAERAFAESLGLKAEGMVESRPIVFPRDVGGEFYELWLAKFRLQFAKESLGNFHRRLRHGIRISQDELFCLRENAAAHIVVQIL